MSGRALARVFFCGLVTVLAVATASAAQSDERAIRAARSAQNRAIADGDLDRVATFWTDDVTVRRALGHPLDGQAAARQALDLPASPDARIVYQRLTREVTVSGQWPLAFETGVWQGHQRTTSGPPL